MRSSSLAPGILSHTLVFYVVLTLGIFLIFLIPTPTAAAEPPHTKTLLYEIVREPEAKSKPVVGLLPIIKNRLKSVKDAFATARLDETGRITVAVTVNDAKKLPDAVKNVEQVLKHLAGQLEFRILANDRDHKKLIEQARKEPNKSKWYDSDGKLTAWFVPFKAGEEKHIVSPEICLRSKKKGKKNIQEVLVVSDPYNVTGKYLVKASPTFDPFTDSPCVAITFNEKGGMLFGKLTGDNLPDSIESETSFRRKLGIILDGELYSAPNIISRITDHAQITGNFKQSEVENICKILNLGSFPARLKKVGEK